MAKIIAITAGKGGTGKSSTCAGVSYALAKKGHRTLIIELDFGLRCLDIMLGIKDKVAFDIGDFLAGRCDIYKTASIVGMANNLQLICAASDPFMEINPDKIMQACLDMGKYYEYIIIDTAGVGAPVFKVLQKADMILMVTTPDPVCVRDASILSDNLYVRGCKNQRLVINKMPDDVLKMGLVSDLDEMIDEVGIQLLGVIPDDINVPLSFGKGVPLPLDAPAQKAYTAIAARITGEEVPLSVR